MSNIFDTDGFDDCSTTSDVSFDCFAEESKMPAPFDGLGETVMNEDFLTVDELILILKKASDQGKGAYAIEVAGEYMLNKGAPVIDDEFEQIELSGQA